MPLAGQKILSLPRKPGFATPAFEADKLEARVGIEPTYKGFADPRLTIWLPRRNSISSLFDHVEQFSRHHRFGDRA